MDDHFCEVCFASMHDHLSRCYGRNDEEEAHFHAPALCCPGCPCGSYEEYHP